MTLTDDSQQCQWATRGGDLGLPVRESEPAAITAAAASRKIHLNNTYQDDIKVCNKHLKWDINDTTLPMVSTLPHHLTKMLTHLLPLALDGPPTTTGEPNT